jgi:hypothetical protein
MKNFYPEDDKFRELMQNHDFEFLPKAWESMQQKLQPNQKSRRLAWWWWGSVGLCGLIGLTFTAYSFMLENQNINEPTNINIFVPASYQKSNNAPQPTNEPQENSKLAKNINTSPKITLPIAQNATKKKNNKVKKDNNKPTILINTLPKIEKFTKPNGIKVQPANLPLALLKTQKEFLNTTENPATEPAKNELCSAEIAELIPNKIELGNNLDIEPAELKKRKNKQLRTQIWLGTSANCPTKNTIAFGLNIGVGLIYQLSKRHELSLGIQYKQLFATPEYVGASFPVLGYVGEGESLNANSPIFSKTQVSELQRIDLLEIPLSYHYQLAPKHSVSANVKMGLVSKIFARNANENKAAALSAKQINMSCTAASVGIGYEWHFAKKWSIAAQANLGLNNLTLKSQKEYRAYTAYAGETSTQGQLFLMIDNNDMVKMPEKLYNSDVQLAAKYTF